jgi:hypothetical protein
MSWPGITPEDYDQALEAVGWERDPAPGGKHHTAWFDSEGTFRVLDIWESEDDFNRFANERLMPGLAAAGLLEGKGEPDVTFAPLHREWSPAHD